MRAPVRFAAGLASAVPAWAERPTLPAGWRVPGQCPARPHHSFAQAPRWRSRTRRQSIGSMPAETCGRPGAPPPFERHARGPHAHASSMRSPCWHFALTEWGPRKTRRGSPVEGIESVRLRASVNAGNYVAGWTFGLGVAFRRLGPKPDGLRRPGRLSTASLPSA